MATYFQDVAEQMRNQIRQGSYPNGKRLPSEDKLADQYGVSRPTLRLALEQLQNEGLVDKRHGSGNFVRWPADRLTYLGTARSTGWHGLNTEVSTTETTADTSVAALLGVEEGEKVTAFTYLARRGTRPRSVTRSYVPARLARLISPDRPQLPWGHDIRQQLTAAGVRLASSTERLVARLPMPCEARTLQISQRTTVLVIGRTLSDVSGRVVEAAVVVLPGQCTEAVFTTHIGLRSDEDESSAPPAERQEAIQLVHSPTPAESDKEVSGD